ncbi:secretory subunit [Tulasnella sp. JGI-2019a]|nr:secretory subunit [Tulasnella sp. JGI-2019a]KAG9040144.1 secretory subunit [Tulasnella sp. JGI-2019a]
MANYQYDESGVLASYFILTFLTLILVPLTFSFLPSTGRKSKIDECECSECQEKRATLKKADSRSILKPRLGYKGLAIMAGWLLFAYLAHKVATTKLENTVYDPFEILGLSYGTTEKEIKRHYKKLSLKFHPDKVQLAENQTMADVEAKFVNITKAYKALTDEEIRQNLEQYGHPDGKQEFSMGLALPTWVVASQNNIWVLGMYAIVFGGLLPVFVSRWWYGSRKYTKDGVLGTTAQLFFKKVREETSNNELIQLLARAWDIEDGSKDIKPASGQVLSKLEADVKAVVGNDFGKTPYTKFRSEDIVARRALALLYAHMLRVHVQDPSLQAEQKSLLLACQPFLASMLSIALSHNWLACSLNVMHLNASLAQAVLPGSDPLLAFPSVNKEEVKAVEGGITAYIKALEQKNDPRSEMVRRVADKWGRLDVVDSQFKVIGERIVTPGAIVQMVVKLRLTPPTVAKSTGQSTPPEQTVDERKKQIRKEEEFLNGKNDTDELYPGLTTPGHAHAPHWPQLRKPTWWVMIGDQKLNKVIVPPSRITDVPFANSGKAPNDYRTYKLQFQAPPQVGVYTFQLLFVSDTYVGEDVKLFLPLKVEDLSALDDEELGEEDEISDPDEDTLAGQMAAMRGGKVKRSAVYDSDESSTDDDQSSGKGSSDSDSDSDSD